MSFDTLAPAYCLMETVLAGGKLQRNRLAYLSETAGAERALLLGEGPGKFLPVLLETNPQVEVTCVEKSPRMIEIARSQLNSQQLARVTFEAVDVLEWDSSPNIFDLVVTNFFLDCFSREDLARVIAKISNGARRNAVWLVTDFREPDNGWQRWRGRLVLAAMYAFFRLATEISARRLTAPDEYLTRSDFRLVSRRLDHFGLIHSDHWRR